MNQAIKDWFDAINLRWFFLGIFVYSAVLAVLIYGFIVPHRKQYDTSIKNQDSINDMYINLISLDIGAAIDSINNQINSLEELEASFRNRLVDPVEFNSIVPAMDQFCSDTKMRILKLEPLDDEKQLPNNFRKKFIKASFSGSYSNFLKLLQKMEFFSKWLLIEKMVISSSKKSNQNTYDLIISVILETDRP